jgi:hypothetical protein
MLIDPQVIENANETELVETGRAIRLRLAKIRNRQVGRPLGSGERKYTCPHCQHEFGITAWRAHSRTACKARQNAVSRPTEPAGAVEDSGVDV